MSLKISSLMVVTIFYEGKICKPDIIKEVFPNPDITLNKWSNLAKLLHLMESFQDTTIDTLNAACMLLGEYQRNYTLVR